MIYVVVITGCEGIESLIWAGMDSEEAVRRTKDLRERLEKVHARYTELEMGCEAILKGSSQEEAHEKFKAAEDVMWKTLEQEFGEDRWLFSMGGGDHVCLQGYDPASDKFACQCAILDVSPSKPMFR